MRQRTFDIVKTWFQEDFGLYGRVDEMICRALAAHPRVGRVIHLGPPASSYDLRHELHAPTWESNMERRLSRFRSLGAQIDGILCYSPKTPRHETERAADLVADFLAQHVTPGAVTAMLTTPPHPFALAVSDRLLPNNIRVAMIQDDHRPYDPASAEGVTAMYRNEIERSDLAIVSSPSLRDEFGGTNTPCFLIPQITEPRPFASAEPAYELADIPRPIAIYTGWLRSRLDMDLIRGVVAGMPDVFFVFVGAGGEHLTETLAGSSNWEIIGPRPYSALPSLLAACDVSIVPHEISSTTEGMMPEKVVHYLAAGLPVVGTPVSGLRSVGDIVRTATTTEGFVAAIRESLMEPPEARIRRQASVAHLATESVAEWYITAFDAILDGVALSPPPMLMG